MKADAPRDKLRVTRMGRRSSSTGYPGPDSRTTHTFMPAIRILFPGRNDVSVIALTGRRIPIGRSSENTLQILDRSISLRHAELIEEGDHYRLHDLGSTNGVFVNGQKVADAHLREPCRLTFGTFECEYLPALPADFNTPIEALPCREETGAAFAENAELKAQIKKLQDEVGGLRTAMGKMEQAGASAVPREQYESILVERDCLKATGSRIEGELGQVQVNLAALRTDRDQLQRVLDAQTAVAAVLPRPGEVELLRAGNIELKSRLEAAAADLDRLRKGASDDADTLAVLRAEHAGVLAQHATLRNAHDRQNAQREQLIAELDSWRAASTELKTHLDSQTRELADLQNVRASLSERTATLVSPDEYAKLAAGRASAEDAKQHLQQELARVAQELAVRTTDYDKLQQTCSRQLEDLERLPTPAEIESLRAANTQLKSKLETAAADLDSLRTGAASDADALAALRARHERDFAELTDLKSAFDLRGLQQEQVTEELESARVSNSDLKVRMEAQARELADLQSAHASLAGQASSLVAPEEHAKLAGEHALATDAQERLQQEMARVRQELAALASDNETLQRICTRQRTELERLPTPAAFESLRAGNAELSACVTSLNGELDSLRAMQAVHAAQLAASVPLAEHEKLLAEQASLKMTRQQRDDELEQTNRRVSELQTRCANLEEELRAREQELATLRCRAIPDRPVPSETPASSPSNALVPPGEKAVNGHPSSPGQLEDILGTLGFSIRPVRLPDRESN